MVAESAAARFGFPPHLVGDEGELLRSLLSAAQRQSIVATDSNDRIVRWSEGAHELYGYASEEVVGRLALADLYAPAEVAGGTPERVRRSAMESGRFDGVVRRRRKDGTDFPAHTTVVPRRDAEGNAIGLLVLSSDASEEEELQSELREAKEYTRSLIESSVSAMVATDTLGVVTDVNRRFEAVTGYPREQLVGTLCKTYFTEPERVEDGLRKILAEGSVLDYPVTVRSKAGQEIPLAFNGGLFKGAAGEIRGTFVEAREATEERRREQELRTTQHLKVALMDSAQDALFVVGGDQVVLEASPSAEKLVGAGREELVGSKLPGYFPDPAAVEAAIARTLQTGAPAEVEHAGPVGATTELSLSILRIAPPNAEAASVLVRAHDRSEEVRLLGQTREAENYIRSVIEAAPDPWALVDASLTIVDANGRMARAAGVPREALLHTEFTALFTDRTAATAALRRALDHGTVANVELKLRTKDGAEVQVAVNADLARGSDGRLRGVLVTVRDVSGARRLEDQIREALNYNRSLIEASPDALATIDRSLTITDVNEQMTRLAGATRGQLLGSSLASYFSDPARVTEGFTTVIQKGVPASVELAFTSRGGRTCDATVSAAVYRDTAGKFRGVLVNVRPIEAQKALERRLRESEAHSRMLIEFHTEMMFVTDSAGTITDVNRQSEVVTGLPREKLVGSPFRGRFVDPAAADLALRTALESGRVENLELGLQGAGGAVRLASCNLALLAAPEGGIRGILIAARDVTEQRRLEQHIRDSERYYRSLIEASPDLLFATDRSLIITDVNRRAAEASGFPRDQLVGSEFPTLFVERDLAGEVVARAHRGEAVVDQPLVLRNRGGRPIHTLVSATVAKDPEGRIERAFLTVHDNTKQRRLETELRESQHYTRGLIEASPDPMITIDPSLIIMDVNEQMVQTTGRSREELIGSEFPQYFTDPGHASAGVKKTLAEGQVSGCDLILNSKSGKRTLVSFNAVVFRDTEGNTRGVFAIARDITQARKDEDELRQARAYAEGILRTGPDPFVVLAPDLSLQDVNEQMTRLTGYARHQLLDYAMPDLFVEPEAVRAALTAGMARGQLTNFEGLVRRRNGQKVPVSMNGAMVRDAAGNPRGFLIAARDISESKRLEDRLRDAQAYSRGLVDSAADLVAVTDPLGTITDLNHQAELLAEEPREAVLGTGIAGRFTEPAKMEALLRRVAAEGRASEPDLTFRSRSGRQTPTSVVAATLKDARGGLRGVLLVGRDTTESRRLQRELEAANSELRDQYAQVQEANRLKSDFLAKMSHELRTPLNGVIGFSEYLLSPKGGGLTATQREQVTDILNCGNHLLDLINDILDLSRLEAGRLDLVPEEFDPRTPLEEVFSVLRPTALDRKVQLQAHTSEKLPRVALDLRRFKQILYNLVSNGIKFTEPGGRVDVTLAPRGEKMVELRVRDTGIGIAREEFGRLFKDFEQLGQGGRRRPGSGLGLSLTKRLVELQGGSIQVESDLGKGSTFTVLLPTRISEAKK